MEMKAMGVFIQIFGRRKLSMHMNILKVFEHIQISVYIYTHVYQIYTSGYSGGLNMICFPLSLQHFSGHHPSGSLVGFIQPQQSLRNDSTTTMEIQSAQRLVWRYYLSLGSECIGTVPGKDVLVHALCKPIMPLELCVLHYRCPKTNLVRPNPKPSGLNQVLQDLYSTPADCHAVTWKW